MRFFLSGIPLLAVIIGFQPVDASAGHKKRFSHRPVLASTSWQYGITQSPRFDYGYGSPGIGVPSPGYPSIAPPQVGYHPGELEGYVRQLYLKYLGREPEPTGYAAWVNTIYQGTTLSEAEVGIMASPETFLRSQNNPELYVQFLFRQASGREPTGQEIEYWVGLLFHRYHGERTGFCRDLLMSLGRY